MRSMRGSSPDSVAQASRSPWNQRATGSPTSRRHSHRIGRFTNDRRSRAVIDTIAAAVTPRPISNDFASSIEIRPAVAVEMM